MAIPGVSDGVEQFVLRLLSTGVTLRDVVCELSERLPADAYPSESPTQVVLEMLCGTIATALEAVDPGELQRAVELIELAHDRTIEHLRLACALSSGMQSDGRRLGRTHG